MRRLLLLVVVGVVLGAPAAAYGAACPDDPQRPPDTWYVQDQTTHGDEWTGEQIARPLPLLHAYEVSVIPGQSRASTDINDLVLTPPAGVPFTRDGHAVIVAPKSAGAVGITATWTEHDGVDPDCSRQATLMLNVVALTQRPTVHVTRHVWSDRPWVSFTITVTRSQFGVPDPIVLRANVVPRASAPSGRPKSLFTLPLGLPAFGTRSPPSGVLARRSAKLSGIKVSALSAFDPSGDEQVSVPAGGTGAQATFLFDGTGRTVPSPFGPVYRTGVLSRRGLLVEVLQDGHVLGRLSTGILCVHPRNLGVYCRLPGYRTST